MSALSTLQVLLVVWAAVTIVFAALVMYRFLVAMKEEDTLILSAAESKMEEEQRAVIGRLHKLRPYLLTSGWLSAALLAAVLVIWIFQKLKETEMM